VEIIIFRKGSRLVGFDIGRTSNRSVSISSVTVFEQYVKMMVN
jgi:hypothetical protein